MTRGPVDYTLLPGNHESGLMYPPWERQVATKPDGTQVKESLDAYNLFTRKLERARRGENSTNRKLQADLRAEGLPWSSLDTWSKQWHWEWRVAQYLSIAPRAIAKATQEAAIKVIEDLDIPLKISQQLRRDIDQGELLQEIVHLYMEEVSYRLHAIKEHRDRGEDLPKGLSLPYAKEIESLARAAMSGADRARMGLNLGTSTREASDISITAYFLSNMSPEAKNHISKADILKVMRQRSQNAKQIGDNGIIEDKRNTDLVSAILREQEEPSD